MSKEELLEKIRQTDSGITIKELFSGRYIKLLDSGLRVVTLCFDGSGRSRTVADALTGQGIPAVRLIGGIRGIVEKKELTPSIPSIQSLLNDCPMLAVILTQEEIAQQYGFLTNLKAFKYPNSTKAIASLQRMEASSDSQ